MKYSHREFRQLLIDAREKNQEPALEKAIPKFAAADYCLKFLIECYPVLGQNKPLQIGVVKQIDRPVWMPLASLRAALRIRTAKTGYLKALAKPGSQRHSLDGEPLAEVSEQHREYARQQLEQAKPEEQPVETTPDDPKPEKKAKESKPRIVISQPAKTEAKQTKIVVKKRRRVLEKQL